MGLFKKRKDHWIIGTARVVSVNQLPRSGTSTNLRADVVVEAPGVQPYAMQYKELVVSIKKFPDPGTVLPVRINPDDHTDIDVLWDDVPTHKDLARQQAEQLAASLRGQPLPPPPGTLATGAGSVPSGVEDIVQQIHRLYPDAQVQYGAPPPMSAPPMVKVTASDTGGDPVERLEKLATLHANGIIDDAQFAQLRTQILGQAGLG